MTSYKPNKVTVLSLWLEFGLGEHLSGPALPLLMLLLTAAALAVAPAAAIAGNITFFFFCVRKIKNDPTYGKIRVTVPIKKRNSDVNRELLVL